MSFENPLFLVFALLVVFPVWLIVYSFKRRQKRLRIYAESKLVNRLVVGESKAIRWIRASVILLTLILLVVAAAGPQINGGKEKVKLRGIDIVVAIDVSNSMLATDLKPSRIEKAKLALTDLLAQLEGDRLGTVVFAGEPVTNLPLCEDRSAAEMVINAISTDAVHMQGTAIGAAIDHAVKSFGQTEEGRGKAIIVISDGENHEDDAVEAAIRAAEQGIVVCTIGIGSTGGTTIPVMDEDGTLTTKKDMNGQTIITKLNDQLLKDIALEGNGTYVRATNEELGLTTIMGQLRALSETSKETERYTSFTPIFHFVVALMIALLIFELFLAEGTRKQKFSAE
ncbi:MAG TPA: VWA domain-containing protein [Bacteroidia bacterium]|nr:VWA domain-containing protein [Bacteroidia bacterium]